MIEINGMKVSGRMPIFTAENRGLVRRGVKTQTRRVMKPQPPADEEWWGPEWYTPVIGDDLEPEPGPDIFGIYGENWGIKCPYGTPGDVRVMPEPLKARAIYGDNPNADAFLCAYSDDDKFFHPFEEWRWQRNTLSSLFMPTALGRTLVRYTRIWAERLQDIGDRDAVREGCFTQARNQDELDWSFRTGYQRLWDSINGKTHPWASNPWVWCIEWEAL